MEISPYLGFNGQCEEAFKFYEKVLGGKIEGIIDLRRLSPRCPNAARNARQNYPRAHARW